MAICKCVTDSNAFPVVIPDYAPEWGLTKREYFAAEVYQSLVSQHINIDATKPELAAEAVRYADALIAALNEIEIGG